MHHTGVRIYLGTANGGIISLETKHVVCRAVPYCACCSMYRRPVRKMDQLRMCCLRAVAGIKWQDRVPNTDTYCECVVFTALKHSSFRRRSAEFVTSFEFRTIASRSRSKIFYGQQTADKRLQLGETVNRYKDGIKKCSLQPSGRY